MHTIQTILYLYLTFLSSQLKNLKEDSFSNQQFGLLFCKDAVPY